MYKLHFKTKALMPDLSQYFPITDPTLIFFVVMLIILFAPIIMGKLRIPHLIGMVLAGVVIGKYGLNILIRDDSFQLFGRVGLLYIMFLAGLEMDLEGVRKSRWRIGFFGVMTFLMPMLLTFITSMTLLHLSALASLMLGCMMSSNTLIAYPIIGRYGLQRNTASTLSVGSSMISLFLALVTLAAVVNAARGTGEWLYWIFFIVKIVAFCVIMILLIPRLVRWFLRKYSDAVMQFIFVMSVLFFSAALSNYIGLEGIFGAFFAGLVLNRFIPKVSPLMNRIEFIGNAIFIPYFLIGVGMLINIRLLFQGGTVLWIMLCLVIFGTLGKAVAAYGTTAFFRMPRLSGDLMFGLTSAHAAGAIAMVMIGIELEVAPGQTLLNNEILNGVVQMILCTCIISSVITENSARKIRLKEKENPSIDKAGDDEKILIAVKYPEYADNLMMLASLMRNQKLSRGLIALNVVYDDINAARNQAEGKRLLEHIKRNCSAADVPLQTQVRLATNIANGIKHAFREYQASEIVMGLHFHPDVSKGFWGQFAQSLYNGLNRQIIIARITQPLNTIRKIQVAVPSRAEYEPGFNRWMERLSRMAGNLDCRVEFHGRKESLVLIREYINNRHPSVRAEFVEMPHWNQLPQLAAKIKDDHMFAVVTARKGTISYKNALEHLPEEISRYFNGKSIMIIYPDQYGETQDQMTFAEPQHTEERSAYDWLRERLRRGIFRSVHLWGTDKRGKGNK